MIKMKSILIWLLATVEYKAIFFDPKAAPAEPPYLNGNDRSRSLTEIEF